MSLVENRETVLGEGERGVTPMVGIVLLFGMVFVGVVLIALTGMMLIDGLQSSTTDDHAEQALRQVDSDLVNDRGTLHLTDHGEYEVSEVGNLSITVSNPFQGECSFVDDAPIGTLQYVNEGGDTVGYQAGGLFRRSDGGSVVVSNPDFEYYTRQVDGQDVQHLDFSVTSLYGEVGHGEHTAKSNQSSQETTDCMDEIRFATSIEIEVRETPYHQGWHQYLADEFDALPPGEATAGDNVVELDEGNQRVVVEASLDRARPFAEYVDLFPTLYGGVYVDDSTVQLGNVTVDGYDSRDGAYGDANVSDDFLIANADRLRIDGDVVGLPVANEDLSVQPQGSVSRVAFYGGDDVSPSGSDDYRATDLSELFDEIEDVDGEIGKAATYLDAGGGAVPTGSEIGAGLYHDGGALDLTGVEFNTTDGNVNIATEGALALSDVDVAGDGQVHIYVNGSDIEVDDVHVPDDRAEALWIYGTSGADVTIEDEFQGIVYAPGGGTLEIADGTTLWGAAVGGEADIGENVEIHFDQSMRSAMPIPDADRTVEFEGTREPLDVTFVLDRSGSMGWNDPDGLRVDATRNFIGMLDADHGDRAGVFEFDQSGYHTHALSSDLESVNDSVQAVEGGSTYISEGLELALDEYLGEEEDGRERVVILLSDGANNCYLYDFDCSDSDLDDSSMDQAFRADDLNATIYTVGLGFDDLNEALLEDMAEVTGGRNVNIDNVEGLHDVFSDIAEDLTDTEISHDTIQHEANPTSNEHVFTFEHVRVDIEE